MAYHKLRIGIGPPLCSPFRNPPLALLATLAMQRALIHLLAILGGKLSQKNRFVSSRRIEGMKDHPFTGPLEAILPLHKVPRPMVPMALKIWYAAGVWIISATAPQNSIMQHRHPTRTRLTDTSLNCYQDLCRLAARHTLVGRCMAPMQIVERGELLHFHRLSKELRHNHCRLEKTLTSRVNLVVCFLVSGASGARRLPGEARCLKTHMMQCQALTSTNSCECKE